MLILFDIDLTLLSTGGAGMRSMRVAGIELFGPMFRVEGVDFAGRLDPLIITDLLRLNDQPNDRDTHALFKKTYERHLHLELARSSSLVVLPGVRALLARLARESTLTLGLLTGNFQSSGLMKLRACDLDPGMFTVGAWGEDSPHIPPKREDLVPVAMDRSMPVRGRRPNPCDVVVIGDTPHDVRCALVHGCRSLAVATGRSSATELQHAGAHRVLPDLSDTDAVVRWLLQTDSALSVPPEPGTVSPTVSRMPDGA